MRDRTEEVQKLLASRVLEAMRKANVAEDDLALETHIPRSRLRKILEGRCDSTTFFEITAFATVLGQPVDSLLR